MKRFLYTVLALMFLAVFPPQLRAAEKPDIVNYTAQYLDRALHVTLQWQSANAVTLVRISAGREAREVKVDEYDNRRVPGGYTGEVTVNIPVDPLLFQKNVPYVLQVEDELRLKSELVTGKAQLPAIALPYGQMGHGQQDNWGQDHLKPTPKSQGGAGDIVDKLIEIKDKFDLAPSITQITPNVTGPNNVSFSMKANDDKQLREINIKVFDSAGNMAQSQQMTGLGRVWEGTSPVFNLSGGTYRVSVQAVDMAGNTSREMTALFVLKGGSIATAQPSVTTPTTPAGDQPPVVIPPPPPPPGDQPTVVIPPPTPPPGDQPPVTTPPTTEPPVVVTPPPTTPSCKTGQTICSGQCTDLLTNALNCGGCGIVCPSGQICDKGKCKVPPVTVLVPTGELIQNGDFSRGGSGWSFETWYQHASPGGEVNFGQPRVTFKSTAGNTRVGIMQEINRDVSGCRTLVLKAVIRADQQTLSGTGYGGREAPVSVFAGYQDASGVERTQNGSLANPVEPQTRQMFWHGFYYMEPAGLSTPARGTKVQQGQWHSYLVDLMQQNPKPRILRFAGAEGAGWASRSGALHQISITCNGDAMPLSTAGIPAGQTVGTTASGMQPLQPPNDPVIYSNGNIAGVQNGPRSATTFSITAPHQVTWIYTYHYFNNGRQPGTISLRHSDGSTYGPFKTEGAVGQGNVANAYWFVRPDVAIKPGTYTVIDSDPGTWSHNSGSSYAGFVELRGRKGAEPSGMQPLQPPNDPVIYSNGNIAGVQNGPRSATTFSITAPHQVTWIYTYHYFNNGRQPGTISLRHSDGSTYGPFKTEGAVGQGNVANAYWFVRPNVAIKPGTYTVIDSDPGTWSHNSGSSYAGFVELRGVPGGGNAQVLGDGAAQASVSVIGVWDTSEGVLALTQVGTTVSGTYSQDNGKIDGIVNGNVLNGYWAETSSGQRCATPHNGNYYWGKIRFVFSGNSFNGAWGYCAANPDHPWSGKKR